MKKQLHYAFLLSALLMGSMPWAHAQSGYFGNFLRHQVFDSTNFNNFTIVDDAALNGDPNKNILITPFAFLTLPGYQENYPTGLYYASGKWAIYREDNVDSIIYPYAGYNLVNPTTNGSAFKHTASAGNTVGNVTYIDHPSTNAKPNALVFITHNWGSVGGVYNNHPTGVYYSNAESKWGIFNEDLFPFPAGAVYNVFVPDSGSPNAFVHTVSSVSALPSTFLNNPVTDANPEAVLIVTHNYNPGGLGGMYNTVPVGVAIKSSAYPLIYHLDHSTPFDSAMSFNVLIADDVSSGLPNSGEAASGLTVYPNPAAAELSIQYEVKEASLSSLKLYDLQGTLVETIQQQWLAPGRYTATANLHALAAGSYLCVLQSGEQLSRKKIVVVH
ncbi:MAG: T9SS type A sorting domain-containing protein [Bacteroidetes bacterium]|nr:T9SS type A sorting domain-containing protein [Bacteroidota bacterium]